MQVRASTAVLLCCVWRRLIILSIWSLLARRSWFGWVQHPFSSSLSISRKRSSFEDQKFPIKNFGSKLLSIDPCCELLLSIIHEEVNYLRIQVYKDPQNNDFIFIGNFKYYPIQNCWDPNLVTKLFCAVSCFSDDVQRQTFSSFRSLILS